MRIPQLLVTVFLAALLHPGAKAQSPAPPPAAYNSTSKPDSSQEPYVFESVHAAMRYEDDGTGSVEITARIRVQSYAGVDQMGQQVFDYESANERMEIRLVKVTKPDGRIIVAGPEAVQDLTAPVAQVAPIYTDEHEKHVTVPGLSVGDILEYDVVRTVLRPVTPGQFWGEWDFVSDGYCLDEQLDLDVPASRALRIIGSDGLDAQPTTKGGRRLYHWQTNNFTALGSAAAAAAASSNSGFNPTQILQSQKALQPRRVIFSTFETWNDVGKWYAALESDRMAPTSELRQKADELVKGAATDADKAYAIYSYVSRSIRYVSLSFGVGRFQPHAAAEVYANQYGDCKDKATLLGTMLAAEGITSSTALINSQADIELGVPAPLQFDHAITVLSVGGKEVWLDSTVGVAPFGYLLPQLRGKRALVVGSAGTGEIRRAPTDFVNPRLYRASLEGKASKTNGELHISFDVQGDDSEVIFRAMLLRYPAATLAAAINQQIKATSTEDSSISDVKTSDPFDTRVPLHFEMTIAGKTSSPAKQSGNDSQSNGSESVVSALSDSGLLSYILPDVPTQSLYLPRFRIGGPEEISLHVKLTDTEDGHSFSVAPVDIKEDFAEYQGRAGWDGDTLTADFDLRLTSDQISSGQIPAYTEFRKKLIESFGPAGRTAALGQMYQDGMSAFDAHNYPRAESLLESVVADDPKYKDAWNNLGRAYLQMNQLDKAEPAFRKAIEVDPQDPYAYNNLGLVFLRQEKYDDAIPQFQKQIAINPKDQYSHANLGSAYLQTKRYDDAVKELQIAAAITPKAVNIQLNLGSAYGNLNRTDEARQAFQQALTLDSSVETLESAAFAIVDAKLPGDWAEKDAQSAIEMTETRLKTTSLDDVQQGDLLVVPTLAGGWTTMGWVKFQKGDLVSAERYLLAAYAISSFPQPGLYDRLGQVYEKQGRTADAKHYYAMELAHHFSFSTDSRVRLAALAGGDANVDRLVDSAKADSVRYQIKNLPKITGHAQFWILYSPNRKAPELKFATGDENMRAMSGNVQAALPAFAAPTPSAHKYLLSFWVFCKSDKSECTTSLAGASVGPPQTFVVRPN